MENTNVVENVEVAVEETVKKKRRAPFKIKVTAAEIIAELDEATAKVEELLTALEELEEGSTAYNLIKEAYDIEAEKLETLSTRIYHA